MAINSVFCRHRSALTAFLHMVNQKASYRILSLQILCSLQLFRMTDMVVCVKRSGQDNVVAAIVIRYRFVFSGLDLI